MTFQRPKKKKIQKTTTKKSHGIPPFKNSIYNESEPVTSVPAQDSSKGERKVTKTTKTMGGGDDKNDGKDGKGGGLEEGERVPAAAGLPTQLLEREAMAAAVTSAPGGTGTGTVPGAVPVPVPVPATDEPPKALQLRVDYATNNQGYDEEAQNGNDKEKEKERERESGDGRPKKRESKKKLVMAPATHEEGINNNQNSGSNGLGTFVFCLYCYVFVRFYNLTPKKNLPFFFPSLFPRLPHSFATTRYKNHFSLIFRGWGGAKIINK